MRIKNKFLEVLNVLQDLYSFYSTKLCTKKPTLPPWLLTTHCISINLLNQEMADEYNKVQCKTFTKILFKFIAYILIGDCAR